MKKIKKEILEAMSFYNNKNTNNLSVTAVANKFNIDKQTLFGYLNFDIQTDNLFFYNDTYYLLTEKEISAVEEYASDPSLTFMYIKEKYGFKNETFKKVLDVVGVKSDRRFKVSFNTNKFREIKTESDAYFLGFILADGYLNNSKNTVRVKVADIDSDILFKLADYLELSHYHIKTEYNLLTGNKQRYLSVYRKGIVANLENKGIHQAKSNNEIPYYKIDPSLVRHYIRGIFDGDGYIFKSGWNIGFSISEEVLLFIKDVFDRNLPEGYSNGKKGVQYDEKSNVYRLRIFGKFNVLSVLDYLYKDSTVYLDRKFNLYNDIKKLPWINRVISVGVK